MRLVLSCLKTNPDERPTFDQIVSIFNDSIFLASACRMERSVSASFWRSYFLDKRVLEHQVSLDKFVLALKDSCVVTEPGFVVGDNEMNILEALFGKMVTLQQFGKISGFYGPILPWQKFFERVDKLLREDWFYGSISQTNTIKALSKQKPGTFLVRLSSRNDDDSFVVAYVNPNKSVKQTKILHPPGKVSPL